MSTRCVYSLVLPICAVLFSVRVHAQFDTVERSGGVNVSGNINYQDYDFSRSRFLTDGIGVFNPGLGSLAAGLSLDGLQVAGANFSASGSAASSFTSNFDGQVIQFQGTASAVMQGESLIGALFGNNEASAGFGSTFNVALPMQAQLSMSSTVSTNSTLTFSIVRQDGFVVWDQVAITTPTGDVTRSFVTQLAFDPGSYTLSTRLRAMAGLDQGMPSDAAAVTSAFTLSPVSEPVIGLLLGLGLWPVLQLGRSRGAQRAIG